MWCLIMRSAPEQPVTGIQLSAEICESITDQVSTEEESPVTPEEVAQLRREKLNAIQLAIARGDYDSDELLEKSMNRLLQRLEQNDQK